MAPSVTLDTSDDFAFPSKTASPPRTLLLAPPSIASHPQKLTAVAESHDRDATDIQMLDRLALGLVSLPAATYDVVLLLTDVDAQQGRLLSREVMELIVPSMKVGGLLKGQSGALASTELTEGILAGLVSGEEGLKKPDTTGAGQTVKLSFGKKKANAAAVPANAVEAVNTAKRKDLHETNTNGATTVTAARPTRQAPVGVGFIDSNDDFDGGFDDGSGYHSEEDDMDIELPTQEELERAERIDPDSLLTEEDRLKPLNIPDACKPNTKRRRACKDCTCGLAERLTAEDAAKRANADSNLAKLAADDLNEVDFTVQGKVGSCGNCALGDAFRCDGCPYIGLPAFKPGEEVRLVSNDVQL